MTAEAYPLSWPNGWPRTGANLRKRAKFSRKETQYSSDGQRSWSVSRDLTIYNAMRRLTDELGRLGAREILVSTNVQLMNNGQPRSDRRAPDDQGVAVYFKLKGKDRVLACDKWDRVPDNIAAIAGHISAIRAQDRYGVGTLDQAFAGYAALPPPGHVHVRAWRDVLLMIEDGSWTPSSRQGTLERAEQQYRRLARERHPDGGGSHAQMSELNAAIAQARQELGA